MGRILQVVAVATFIVGTASVARAQDTAARTATLSDAEIAAIVVAANAVDAEIGDVAAERATDAGIRQFGTTMGADHRAVNKSAAELVARLNVSPVESAVSRKLRADGAAFLVELRKKSGAAFDRAYIEHEVEYHKAVIAAVDEALIPNATNEELKKTLISVRPALVAHLKHAQHLRAGLK
jgi:putative membrane protein